MKILYIILIFQTVLIVQTQQLSLFGQKKQKVNYTIEDVETLAKQIKSMSSSSTNVSPSNVYLWDTLSAKVRYFLLNQNKVKSIETKIVNFDWTALSDRVRNVLLEKQNAGLRLLANMTLYEWGVVDANHRLAHLTAYSMIDKDKQEQIDKLNQIAAPLKLNLLIDKKSLIEYLNKQQPSSNFLFFKWKNDFTKIWKPVESYLDSLINLDNLSIKDKVDLSVVGLKAFANFGSKYYFHI
jgi:hypothetical protein